MTLSIHQLYPIGEMKVVHMNGAKVRISIESIAGAFVSGTVVACDPPDIYQIGGYVTFNGELIITNVLSDTIGMNAN